MLGILQASELELTEYQTSAMKPEIQVEHTDLIQH